VRRLLPTFALIAGCADETVPARQPIDAGVDAPDLGPFGPACAEICGAQEELCPAEKDPFCLESCAAAPSHAGDCEGVLGPYILCLGEHAGELTSCLAADYPQACTEAHDAWVGCGNISGCGVVECKDVGDGACSCSAICEGVTYTDACQQADGGWDCSCSANGQLDVECPGLPNACAFFVGCCARSLP